MFNAILNFIQNTYKGPKPQPWDKLLHSSRTGGTFTHMRQTKFKGPRPASSYRGYRMNVIKHKRVINATA